MSGVIRRVSSIVSTVASAANSAVGRWLTSLISSRDDLLAEGRGMGTDDATGGWTPKEAFQMARLLTGMWLVLVLSFSSMFFLMGSFLSERKQTAVSSTTAPPLARLPRNSGTVEGAGLAIIEARRAVPQGGFAGDEERTIAGSEPADEAPQQVTDDDLKSRPSVALSPNTERAKPLKRVNASASPKARPPIYSKNMKRPSSHERRRMGGRFGNRRLFR